MGVQELLERVFMGLVGNEAAETRGLLLRVVDAGSTGKCGVLHSGGIIR